MNKDYHTDNKCFQIYKNWEEFILELDNNEQIGELFKALFAFAKRGEEAEFKGALKMAFAVMRQTIEADGLKWERKCERNSENVRKRWDKNNTNVYDRIQANTNNTDIDIDIDKDINPPISPKGDKQEIKPEIGLISESKSTERNTAGESSDSFSESFNDFWKAYPKKVSKAQALNAWNKLKPDNDLVREILSALERQKQSAQWQKDNGQFIPYPATWLNGRRWEDEQTEEASAMPNYNWGIEGVDYL